jgi:hypothetical protein
MLAMWCKHCGAPLPAVRSAKQLYCGPECKKASQRDRDGKLPTDARPNSFNGAPGCGCGTCLECSLHARMKSDSAIWLAKRARAERGS